MTAQCKPPTIEELATQIDSLWTTLRVQEDAFQFSARLLGQKLEVQENELDTLRTAARVRHQHELDLLVTIEKQQRVHTELIATLQREHTEQMATLWADQQQQQATAAGNHHRTQEELRQVVRFSEGLVNTWIADLRRDLGASQKEVTGLAHELDRRFRDHRSSVPVTPPEAR
jgi:hypothetical protein